MMRLLTVVGARPQFVKAAVVARALAKRDEIDHKLIHTGQHFDQRMSAQFFDELAIPEPDHNLANFRRPSRPDDRAHDGGDRAGAA